jgi:hypothetical protein
VGAWKLYVQFHGAKDGLLGLSSANENASAGKGLVDDDKDVKQKRGQNEDKKNGARGFDNGHRRLALSSSSSSFFFQS